VCGGGLVAVSEIKMGPDSVVFEFITVKLALRRIAIIVLKHQLVLNAKDFWPFELETHSDG
jgi:hypothetical protein